MRLQRLTSITFLTLLVLAQVSPGVFAQDKLVGKKATLKEMESFFPKLDNAALYYVSLGEDYGDLDVGIDTFDGFLCEKSTRIHVLESSYQPLAEGVKFYKVRVLSGRNKGRVGWGFWLKTTRGSTSPRSRTKKKKRSKYKPSYPTKD